MNNFFGYAVVEKVKLVSFDDEKETILIINSPKKNVTINKYHKKLDNVKNKKIKKSLLELTKVFKEK